MAQLQPNNPTKSTQNSLLITEIKDGIVVLRDGSLRAVVAASAINFDLMNQQEQDGVEFAYQGFLNSLHFPIQIVVRSQKLDLDSYIEGLTKTRQEQDNQLLGLLMDDYIANIKGLVEEVNIMDKQFYIVVPYFPPATQTKGGLLGSINSIFKAPDVITLDEAHFQQFKMELSQRVQLVTSGLNQLGIRAISLNTQELIELYYSFYNPDTAANQKLIDAGQLQSAAVVRKAAPAAPQTAAPAVQPNLNPVDSVVPPQPSDSTPASTPIAADRQGVPPAPAYQPPTAVPPTPPLAPPAPLTPPPTEAPLAPGQTVYPAAPAETQPEPPQPPPPAGGPPVAPGGSA